MWRPVCFPKLHWGQSKAVRTGLCQTCLAASFAGEKVRRFLQRATGKGTANHGATVDLEVQCATGTSCSLLRWSRRKVKRENGKEGEGK
jgi:hypothetical protein